MENLELILAEVLDEIRIKKDLSYQDIADYLDVSRYTVRDYMKGRSRLYWSTLLKICHALNVEYKEVIEIVEGRLRKWHFGTKQGQYYEYK